MIKRYNLKAYQRTAIGTANPTIFRICEGGRDLNNVPTYCVQTRNEEIYISKAELQDALLEIEKEVSHGTHAKSN